MIQTPTPTKTITNLAVGLANQATKHYLNNEFKNLADRHPEWPAEAMPEIAKAYGQGWYDCVMRLHHEGIIQDPGD